MNKVRITSETGDLKKVIIHSPDEGIEKVTPRTAIDLLYEDIVYLPRMQKEHKVFTDLLSFFIEKENVLDVQDLLSHVLENAQARKDLLGQLSQSEEIRAALMRKMSSMPAADLATVLITGCFNSEPAFQFNPLPNLIFTRDIGVVINDHVLISKAAKKARFRESLIAGSIVKNHPLFEEVRNNIIEFSGFDSNVSIEGGDILVLNHDHILIASSERTTPDAVERITEILSDRKVVKRISRVDLPAVRFCMHLDTIFTRVSSRHFVGFAPLVTEDKKMPVVHYEGGTRAAMFSSISTMMEHFYPESEIIPCGKNVSPYDEREQWTDGCNLFAVREGVAFTYDRNVRTNQALEEAGYKVVSGEDVLKEAHSGKVKKEDFQNIIITIPSGELSRARGGPHCMTMPVLRT